MRRLVDDPVTIVGRLSINGRKAAVPDVPERGSGRIYRWGLLPGFMP